MIVKFCRLRISNFKVIGAADVDLLDRGLVLIVADNQDTQAATSVGSGKTTVFEAITWCLFGEVAVHGKLADEAIRRGASEARVELSFTVGGTMYEVERRRDKRSTTLTLTVDGAPENGRTKDDTQDWIVELLGLDWESFRNTVLYGQNDTGRFADRGTTDGERKSVLRTILQLEQYERALKRVRAAKAEVNERVSKAEMKQNAAHDRRVRAQRALDHALEQIEEWSSEVAELRATILSDIEDIEQLEPEPGDDVVRLRELCHKFELLREEQHQVALEASQLPITLKTAVDARAATKAELKRAQHDVLVAYQKLKDFDFVVKEERSCPMCGRFLDEETGTLGEHRESRVNDHQAAVDVEDRLVAALEAIPNRALELDAARTAEAEAWREVRKTKDVLIVLKTRIEVAELRADKIASAEHDLAVLQAKLAAIPTVNPHRVTLKRATEELNAANEEYNAADTAFTTVQGQMAPLLFWEEAFGNRGIPSFALDSVLPTLNESIARYLHVLADGDIKVELTNTTTLKGGGKKEMIDVLVEAEGVADTTPSGGQWKKISIAVDLALMDLVASRSNVRVDALFLDEVLDGLDDESKSRVVILLRHLREHRSTIMVVSHDAQVAESFERTIVVTKRNQIATVEG